ncbi:amidase signature enzyme [Lentithecium fluviatile CBS 122367]|uniref:Amidase signature enzyme n=1 Tax=Lentithecium fluviatile CBS 122367 TaxID=1168545 RepID=A0A6G1J689_9PLEO|nr:amidase signature enzyme [Lentithecium fluviatile CBS 122367]
MAANGLASSNAHSDLHYSTASEIVPLLKSGVITVEQYVRSLLARIHERDDHVQAWAYLDPDYAICEAKALDQVPEDRRGILHGIPIAVKDVINTKDLPTQHHSPSYQGSRPGIDATPIGVLRAAGALIIGKTTTTQFAAINIGTKTRNPHDPKRTPGGSSSGSAAAVADYQVPLAVGTQTAGSVIRPASYCGIYGMKPTWNAISTEGLKIFSISVDTFGFFARSLEDLELLADVFALADDGDPPTEEPLTVDKCKVGILKTMVWSRAGPGTVAAMQLAVEILKKYGAAVTELNLPGEFDSLPDYHEQVVAGDARASFLGEYRMHRRGLDQELADYVENKSNMSWKEHLHAKDRVAALRSMFESFAEQYTVIVTPSVIDEAPLGLEYTGSPAFNAIWTSLHLPVVNIPAFKGEHGMPIGISLVLPRYRDKRLLRVAKVIGECLTRDGGWKAES